MFAIYPTAGGLVCSDTGAFLCSKEHSANTKTRILNGGFLYLWCFKLFFTAHGDHLFHCIALVCLPGTTGDVTRVSASLN